MVPWFFSGLAGSVLITCMEVSSLRYKDSAEDLAVFLSDTKRKILSPLPLTPNQIEGFVFPGLF